SRWAPDGTRFLFVQYSSTSAQVTIANTSGGRWTVVAEGSDFRAPAWSPDSQWIAFVKTESRKEQLVKMRPAAGATPMVLAHASPALTGFDSIQWSPKGDWI